jgi:hypothetical protein
MKFFKEFNEEEQKVIIDKNIEFLRNEYFSKEKDNLFKQFCNELNDFKIKWNILKDSWLSVFITSYNTVEFKAVIQEIDVEEIKEVLKKERFKEMKEEALENIQWITNLPYNSYSIELELYNNSFHLDFINSYSYANYLMEGGSEERLQYLSNCREEKVQKAILEFQLKKVFEKSKYNTETNIDKILEIALDEKIKWVKKIENEINYELTKIEESMNKRNEYLVSDQFLVDKLNKNEELLVDQYNKIFYK